MYWNAESVNWRRELAVGSRVDVHTRYESGRWVRGFTIAEIRPDGYRIKRASDGSVLGAIFGADELRAVASPPMAAWSWKPPTEPPPEGRVGPSTPFAGSGDQ
jgi:hypothetical protein